MKRLADSKETSLEKGELGLGWLHPWDVLILKNIPRHPGCNIKKAIPAPELDSAGDHQLSHFRLKNAETILSTSKQQPHPKKSSSPLHTMLFSSHPPRRSTPPPRPLSSTSWGKYSPREWQEKPPNDK